MVTGEERPGESAAPTVLIANDVIGEIAGLAAAEVDGVSALSGGLVGGITEMLGKKVPRGVRVEVRGRAVELDLYIVVQYGGKIPDIANRVQQRVKRRVEAMTGLTVQAVNVHIQGVAFANRSDNGE